MGKVRSSSSIKSNTDENNSKESSNLTAVNGVSKASPTSEASPTKPVPSKPPSTTKPSPKTRTPISKADFLASIVASNGTPTKRATKKTDDEVSSNVKPSESTNKTSVDSTITTPTVNPVDKPNGSLNPSKVESTPVPALRQSLPQTTESTPKAPSSTTTDDTPKVTPVPRILPQAATTVVSKKKSIRKPISLETEGIASDESNFEDERRTRFAARQRNDDNASQSSSSSSSSDSDDFEDARDNFMETDL